VKNGDQIENSTQHCAPSRGKIDHCSRCPKGEVECKMTAGSTGSELNSPTAMLFGLSRAQRLPKNHCRI
jgi:hypothetical protein